MTHHMIVFTYPGQGSQTPAIGESWIDHPSWEVVAEASEAAERDLAHLLLHADAEELRQTRNAQLATFVASLVVLDAVERVGVSAAAHAGHSLGEYTALTASGALDVADGVRLVAERAEAMQAAADDVEGTMAAVLGLDDEAIDVACHRVLGDVWIANYNAPGQVVIAGRPDAIDEAAAVCRELGAKRVMPLAVGGAFHTPLMAPARDRLRKAIATTEFRRPDGLLVANVDARPHDDPAEWESLLTAQLCSPVRWRQTLVILADAGCTTYVEVGPGTVLTGLAKRTLDRPRTISVSTPADLDLLLEALAQPSTDVGQHEGEHLFATERLVVSPAAGVFHPADDLDPGGPIHTGQVVGSVGLVDIRSPFRGQLMGYLAVDGERITPSQPILWLRTT